MGKYFYNFDIHYTIQFSLEQLLLAKEKLHTQKNNEKFDWMKPNQVSVLRILAAFYKINFPIILV